MLVDYVPYGLCIMMDHCVAYRGEQMMKCLSELGTTTPSYLKPPDPLVHPRHPHASSRCPAHHRRSPSVRRAPPARIPVSNRRGELMLLKTQSSWLLMRLLARDAQSVFVNHLTDVEKDIRPTSRSTSVVKSIDHRGWGSHEQNGN
ncbi:hypothetical protein EYF80_018761 [Liparis tanakae]|uniref:Uncharacterized protein n=1 Tax=Liparis tanakae TaxID=230148 RepID=A0A4Z2I032_9TELE|nr:hypothetical protein EYF80_018761 [Liparis tanakae]